MGEMHILGWYKLICTVAEGVERHICNSESDIYLAKEQQIEVFIKKIKFIKHFFLIFLISITFEIAFLQVPFLHFVSIYKL